MSETEVSMTDRIMNALGQSEVTEEAEHTESTQAEAPVDDGLAEIDWEGTKYKVPTVLKDAFMKNADYTQKTQSLAERQRALDHALELSRTSALEQGFLKSITAESQELSVVEAYLQQATKVDWNSMSMEQMLRHRAQIDEVKERRDGLKKAISDKRQAFDEEVKKTIGNLRAKARESASKSIKDFSEDTEKAIRSFAIAEGLTESQVENVLLDPTSYRILWKAMQFDKVKATAGSAVERATKVVRPGASGERMPEDVKARLNFRKELKGSKTSGDKARVIEGRLENLFARGIK